MVIPRPPPPPPLCAHHDHDVRTQIPLSHPLPPHLSGLHLSHHRRKQHPSIHPKSGKLLQTSPRQRKNCQARRTRLREQMPAEYRVIPPGERRTRGVLDERVKEIARARGDLNSFYTSHRPHSPTHPCPNHFFRACNTARIAEGTEDGGRKGGGDGGVKQARAASRVSAPASGSLPHDGSRASKGLNLWRDAARVREKERVSAGGGHRSAAVARGGGGGGALALAAGVRIGRRSNAATR